MTFIKFINLATELILLQTNINNIIKRMWSRCECVKNTKKKKVKPKGQGVTKEEDQITTRFGYFVYFKYSFKKSTKFQRYHQVVFESITDLSSEIICLVFFCFVWVDLITAWYQLLKEADDEWVTWSRSQLVFSLFLIWCFIFYECDHLNPVRWLIVLI